MLANDLGYDRRHIMAGCTFATALALLSFTAVTSSTGRMISSSVAALMQNVMYGLIYSYTPLLFPPETKGTTIGLAAASGRIFGAFTPLLTGALIEVSSVLPLYVAAVFLGISGVSMLMLPRVLVREVSPSH